VRVRLHGVCGWWVVGCQVLLAAVALLSAPALARRHPTAHHPTAHRRPVSAHRAHPHIRVKAHARVKARHLAASRRSRKLRRPLYHRAFIHHQEQSASPSVATQAGPQRRLPERAPGFAAIQGVVRDQFGDAVPAATVILRPSGGGKSSSVTSSVEGIFRLVNLLSGEYEIRVEKDGFEGATVSPIALAESALVSVSVAIRDLDSKIPEIKSVRGVPGPMRLPPLPEPRLGAYPGMREARPGSNPVEGPPEDIPSYDANFRSQVDRWYIPLPDWQRYGTQPDTPYVHHHWYDPYNRNRLKGDYPIFGQQWFLNFTGESITGIDVRRLPIPSGVSAENPGRQDFFGKGQQSLTTQTFRLSFDLFRGDTTFRPIDFRFHFTPVFNLNFLQTRERGLVNIDVRRGINRFDTKSASLQEGFVEAKVRDLSSNYDFVSIRAGIQSFNSDFRGFIFSEEQPGVRVFGNLRSNRINYNAAYFYLLEKDTNSELNTFDKRGQQVYIANVYIQDFGAKGFTQEFSFHFNRDDADIHFDRNGFLVRPTPVGTVVDCKPDTTQFCIKAHDIRAYYLGWTSNGHIGRLNVNHAFYQVLGHDTFNPVAGRRVDINAQMAALELSVDKDWMRYRASFFFASGDSSNRSGPSRTDSTARGFDTIVDNTHFAGSDFSFFNHEAIRLTGTGVGLVQPSSLLASLRTSKTEGQANFVNPGIWIGNLGADFDITPKLRGFVNANYLRFDRTEPLELLLFQRPIRHSIGTDLGLGFEYRPPLSENIVIRGGASALIPGTGFKDILNGRVLYNGFVTVKFQF
jgi:hypothetical protein